jgi:hypothetical protein
MRPASAPDPDAASAPAGLDPRVHDAVTDMHAYAMFLEAQGAQDDPGLRDEVGALRAATAALRELGSTDGQ